MYGDGEIDKTHTSSASFTALGTSRTTRYGIIGDGSESSAEGNSLNGIYFDGDIGAIMFWDSTVLSPGQIRRIWQQQRGTYGV
jgi:hypothetical protein